MTASSTDAPHGRPLTHSDLGKGRESSFRDPQAAGHGPVTRRLSPQSLLHAPRLGQGGIYLRRSGLSFNVSVSRRDDYDIVVGRGSLAHLAEHLAPFMAANDSESAVIICDNNVRPLYLDSVRGLLEAEGISCADLEVPAGELSKSVATAQGLWDDLRRLGVRRRSVLIALGGGVVCDLVGFVASGYMRGVPYVNVGTSLMGQVDGAIGGKVGVDHRTGKNLIGAFYHPGLVVIDPECLKTLPRREIVNGLAEVVKVAMISSADLFARLERIDLGKEEDGPIGDALLRRFDPIISEAIRIKLDLLAPDPFEQDLHRLLNLGHSVGHALEAATSYTRYRHGEAVAIGIATVSAIAANEGICSRETLQRILDLLRRLGLPAAVPEELRNAVWAHLESIRLVRNGKLLLVLPFQIGQCEIIDDVSRDQLDAACDRVMGAC